MQLTSIVCTVLSALMLATPICAHCGGMGCDGKRSLTSLPREWLGMNKEAPAEGLVTK